MYVLMCSAVYKLQKKRKRVGPVDPPQIGPFEIDRVRSGSKTQNPSTRPVSSRYCLKQLNSDLGNCSLFTAMPSGTRVGHREKEGEATFFPVIFPFNDLIRGAHTPHLSLFLSLLLHWKIQSFIFLGSSFLSAPHISLRGAYKLSSDDRQASNMADAYWRRDSSVRCRERRGSMGVGERIYGREVWV
ncbi:hypothetical protein ACFX2H_032470 [Malus domestica]